VSGGPVCNSLLDSLTNFIPNRDTAVLSIVDLYGLDASLPKAAVLRGDHVMTITIDEAVASYIRTQTDQEIYNHAKKGSLEVPGFPDLTGANSVQTSSPAEDPRSTMTLKVCSFVANVEDGGSLIIKGSALDRWKNDEERKEILDQLVREHNEEFNKGNLDDTLKTEAKGKRKRGSEDDDDDDDETTGPAASLNAKKIELQVAGDVAATKDELMKQGAVFPS
jgi:hypothetical protein